MQRYTFRGIPQKNIIDNNEVAFLVKKVKDFNCEKSFDIIRSILEVPIKSLSRKYIIQNYDHEDIEQECLLALRDKVIEDFNPSKGSFKSFAVLCIKRHLLSIIKKNNQQKRKVALQCISLDQDRTDDHGEHLTLAALVADKHMTGDEQFAHDEILDMQVEKLRESLSDLERDVFDLYIQRFRYNEIVEMLMEKYPDQISKKAVDNASTRARTKARTDKQEIDW
jgi:RNA polymerase sporulation-specific sigma factor